MVLVVQASLLGDLPIMGLVTASLAHGTTMQRDVDMHLIVSFVTCAQWVK
jgi:hypothetical protein